jgi:septal ring factor EnvC (AmiA/AmiB activator)
MDLYALSAELRSHASKQELMRKQVTESNLNIYRLEQENKKLKNELSILCPIADLPVIESLKSEKLLMMEQLAEQEKEIESLSCTLKETNDYYVNIDKKIERYEKALKEIRDKHYNDKTGVIAKEALKR